MAAFSEHLLTALVRLPAKSKLGLIFGLAAAIALVSASWMWSTTPDYRVLYSNLSDRDGGAIIGSLNQMNVPYKFSEGGGALLVPSSQVHDVRLKLASQGLPKGSLVGFELMENQKFGISQFQEQVNYQRALEGELARSIESLAAVRNARVHLAIPKASAFVRDQQKPTASVLVSLHPGRTLERQQISGIVHLVASSIPKLIPRNVSVLDQAGTLLSAASDSGLDLDPAQLAYVQQVETNHARRIQDILEPIVGRGNVRAQVTADIDFAHIESTAETYKPNQGAGAGSVRTQRMAEAGSALAAPAQGVPGAASNQPAAAPAAALPSSGSNNARKESQVSYEVDRTVSHTRQPVGTVKRLSAAIVVNHKRSTSPEGKVSFNALSADQMAQINALAKEAMGFSQQRGDSLNVTNAVFTLEEREAAPEVPFWQQPETLTLAKEAGKTGALGLLVLYLVFGVIRPLFRQVGEAAEAMRDAPPQLEMAGPMDVTPLPTADNRLESVRQLARQDPKIVANVVKNWVSKE